MRKPTVKCALLAAMLAKHGWGTPIDEDHLLAVAAIDGDEYPVAREEFADLRGATYTVNRGSRGIELDTGEFGTLAEVLYHECEWKPFEIRSRLKHYEGWENHEWA
jgi:hypothetical protein